MTDARTPIEQFGIRYPNGHTEWADLDDPKRIGGWELEYPKDRERVQDRYDEGFRRLHLEHVPATRLVFVRRTVSHVYGPEEVLT